MNSKNPIPLVCGLLAAISLNTSAQITVTVGGTGATNDVTKASSWTSNNTVYDGTNGGSAMHWENVTTNTATPDGTDSFFDVTWGTSGTGYNIGRVYMYNNGDTAVDLATLNAEGITSIAWDVEFNASSFTNWYPVIAVTDAGTTTYYILQGNHGWDWNGNGPHDFTSKTNLANNDIWWGILPVNDGTDLGNIIDTKDPNSNPNIRRALLDYDTATTTWILEGSPLSGTVDFGVMQWGGSGGGGVADPTAFTTEIVTFEVVVTSETTPDPDFYIGGLLANATPDVTDVTNWTTNNVDYIQDATLGVDDGYALNWENVTTNTGVANGTTHFDGGMVGGPNVTIGRLYMYTAESVDLSTLSNGVTRLSMIGDFETSTTALDHWIPVMAITDGGVTRYYRSNNTGND